MLWYRRFDHLNFGGLNLLPKEKMTIGFPRVTSKKEMCEPCVYEKQDKERFPGKTSWRATQPLMLVHTNVYGLMQKPSLNDTRYFLKSLFMISQG